MCSCAHAGSRRRLQQRPRRPWIAVNSQSGGLSSVHRSSSMHRARTHTQRRAATHKGRGALAAHTLALQPAPGGTRIPPHPPFLSRRRRRSSHAAAAAPSPPQPPPPPPAPAAKDGGPGADGRRVVGGGGDGWGCGGAAGQDERGGGGRAAGRRPARLFPRHRLDGARAPRRCSLLLPAAVCLLPDQAPRTMGGEWDRARLPPRPPPPR